MSVMIGEAVANALADVAAGISHPIRKRVVPQMLRVYLKAGWTFESYDGRGNVLIVWNKPGAPS